MKAKFDFSEVEKAFDKFKKNAKEIEEGISVSFDELFKSSFMERYTDSSTFDEFLSAGGFVVNSQENFERIPEEQMDSHVQKHTRFDKWEDMLGKATELYVAKKLGL